MSLGDSGGFSTLPLHQFTCVQEPNPAPPGANTEHLQTFMGPRLECKGLDSYLD